MAAHRGTLFALVPGALLGTLTSAEGRFARAVRAVRESSVGALANPATGVASLSHRGGTAWPILTTEARCWILTRMLR